MKKFSMLVLVLALAACKVEKTGEDTYKVTTPTPEAKAAAEKAKENAKVVGAEVKENAGKAAEATGTALQELGQKAQDKTSTPEKTTTVTETTVTTSTTSTTTTRH